jgi:hypothetical protein
MTNPDSLRTLLAQARLHVRRAQHDIVSEPPKRSAASNECDSACSLIDSVMRALDVPAVDSEAAQ